MNKFLKISRIIIFFICVIVIVYFIINRMTHVFFHEIYDKKYINNFEEIMKQDFIKAVIYYESNKNERNFKVVITDKKIIKEIIDASTIDYGTKSYSGQYDQFYQIKLERKDGTTYLYNFNKSFTPKYNPCRKNIKYKNKLYPNPYNDCGLLGIYENPSISEKDIINHSYLTPKVAAYNLKLINILEKYADNIPFDGKNKVPFYNRFELREMKKKNQTNN